MEFDAHCFLISAHRTFIGSRFIIGVIRWFDARQKQLQSAMRTAPSRNWRQRGWITTIWLWHGALPKVDRREHYFLSLGHRRPDAELCRWCWHWTLGQRPASIREGLKHLSFSEARKDRERCDLSKCSLPDIGRRKPTV